MSNRKCQQIQETTRLMARGSRPWLMAQGQENLALGPGGLGDPASNFLGLEQRASRHEP